LDGQGKERALAGSDSAKGGLLVCRTDRQREMPGGDRAVSWAQFPNWLAALLDQAPRP
jgi:hypothetical protein